MSTPETEVARELGAPDAPLLDDRLAGLPARAQRLLRDARQAIEKRRPREAHQLLQRAREWSGEHPEYLRLAGITLQLQGRAPEAVVSLRRALERAPGDALILNNLGGALRAAGDYETAIVTLRRACDVAPDLAASWFNLGRALASDKRTGEAHEAYARA
ncbi:MAG: tetratricopeptide repeat protein, partial [Rhodanobacteraceae bacterium]